MTNTDDARRELAEIEEHTIGSSKGPWRVTRHNDRKIVGVDDLKIATAVVMSGPRNKRDEDEAYYNAQLIAAAPDLLRIATTLAQRVTDLEKVMRRLVNVADEYAADQSRAPSPACGLVQPIDVATGEELCNALRLARITLEEIQS